MARFLDWILLLSLRAMTGVTSRWEGCRAEARQRIYCVNHTSHLDFPLVRAALPPAFRKAARPVAAADYWESGAVRRYMIHRVFNAITVERGSGAPQAIDPVRAALRAGDSVIYFPEGTRGPGRELQPLKSGIYHLSREFPAAEVVPVWIDNAWRVMPKGAILPVPLLCSVTFGAPLAAAEEEERDAFLARLRVAMEALRP
jgi:1-acyl-sn-glycerol-3-phosphate acyltransferase